MIANTTGRLCGRLYQRADGTFLTKDCPVGFHVKVRRISRIAGAALAAASVGVGFAAGQSVPAPVPGHVEAVKNRETGIIVEVCDAIGARIPNARVSLSDDRGHEQLSGTTDDNGMFRTHSLRPGIYSIRIESAGFTSAVVKSITVANNEVVVALKLTLEVATTLGEVVGVDVEVEPETSKLPAKIELRLPSFPATVSGASKK